MTVKHSNYSLSLYPINKNKSFNMFNIQSYRHMYINVSVSKNNFLRSYNKVQWEENEEYKENEMCLMKHRHRYTWYKVGDQLFAYAVLSLD